ncbi:helix-turn-helix domain-containing protein [Pseudonocardia sp.]|uniref:helix-turn-helix domain-containing protein n=1 Tax=Pseudonocardia sp. TaxID=60912 RepID=UPI003D10EF49
MTTPRSGEPRRRPRWPRVIDDFAAAAAGGLPAVAETAVRAVRPLVGADAAAVVRWQDGQPVVLAVRGDLAGVLERRPEEGTSAHAGRPVAAVTVDPRTDVVVTRSALVPFSDADMEALRAVGELVDWAGGGHRPDLLARGFAGRVVGSLDPDEVMVSVADGIAALMRAEIAGVMLCDASGDYVEMQRVIGATRQEVSRLRIRTGQGLAGRVMESGRPERLDDYSTDPRSAPEFMALSDVEGTCSAIAVPLVWDGALTGVLCGWRRRRQPFTDADEALFAGFAELCGAAIHNAQRHHAQRVRADRLEAAHRTLEERHQAAQRDLQVYGELTRVAVEGGDVGALVRAVGTLTGGTAVVVTEDGRVLGSPARGPDPVTRAVQRAATDAGELDDNGAPLCLRQDDGSWLLVVPVRAAGVTFGRLGLALPAAPTAGDRLAATQAAVVSALLLAREEAAVAAARRLQAEFVWDLLDGRLPDSVEAGVRARHLGAAFALPARVVAITLRGLACGAAADGWSPELLERARGTCARLITQALDAARAGAVLARRANTFALVVPCGPGDSLDNARRLGAALATIRWPEGMTAAIGVGGAVGEVAGFPQGWRQAQLARSAVAESGEPAVFEDLGVLQFLLSPSSRDDLDGFAHRQLGPVLAYDARRGTELTRTLGVYISAGCSTRRTAELMCIHHRTVSYRLKRVCDLTGFSLDDQEDLFRIQLACKILALSAPGVSTGPGG